jgi:hypothetical protein
MARREYLDTERTATRLQQTLRIMAETSELPEPVRVEVSARDAARQERILRAQRQAEERRVKAQLARTRTQHVDAASQRRRRGRRLASILLLVATVIIGLQLWLVLTTGVASGSWWVVTAGAGIGLIGVTVRRRVELRSQQVSVVATKSEPVREQRTVRDERGGASTWTPVPLPRPLYLSKPQLQSVEPAPDLAAQLRLAQLAAEDALRAAHAEPEVVPFAPPAPSRWAAMGRVDATGGTNAAAPDLDEVLRRRRNAG